MDSNKIEIETTELTELLRQNAQYKADVEETKRIFKNLLIEFGLLDATTQQLKPEFTENQNKIVTHVIGQIMDLISLYTKSQMPVFGKSAEKQLQIKTTALKDIVPLFSKYA